MIKHIYYFDSKYSVLTVRQKTVPCWPFRCGEVELHNEIESLSMLINDSTTPLDILSHLFTNKLMSVFPNLSTVLRVYFTLPVPVAHSERSFSKLKMIQNDLSSMSVCILVNSILILYMKIICTKEGISEGAPSSCQTYIEEHSSS